MLALLVCVSGCAGTTASSGSRSPIEQVPKAPTLRDTDRGRIAEVYDLVLTASRRYQVDPALVLGVIWVESRFQPDARSSAGAKGLMQLMPATARGLRKEMPWRRGSDYETEFNVHAGTYLLAQNLRRFEGRPELALAAYNAGPTAVRRWMKQGKSIPNSVRNYIVKVETAQHFFQKQENAQGPNKVPETAKPPTKAKPTLLNKPPVARKALAPARKPAATERSATPNDRQRDPDRSTRSTSGKRPAKKPSSATSPSESTKRSATELPDVLDSPQT